MIWVLLSPPPHLTYNRIVKAASDLHFELEDAGWTEIGSGNWYDMCELDQSLHADLEESHPILMFCQKNSSYIYHNEESLTAMLELEPNYLDKKLFL